MRKRRPQGLSVWFQRVRRRIPSRISVNGVTAVLSENWALLQLLSSHASRPCLYADALADDVAVPPLSIQHL